jgi:hypothetical protein
LHDDYVTTTTLLAELAAVAAEQRALDARRVALAGELAALSDRSLGEAGVARRAGFRSAAFMLEELWQVSVGEARRFCEVGLATRARQALDGSPLPARFEFVADGIASCTLGVAAAGVIVRELEAASVRCSAQARREAEELLVSRAAEFTVAELQVVARHAREVLDQDGSEPRDVRQRARRSLRFIPDSDGMVRLEWVMAPETAGLVQANLNAIVGSEIRSARDTEVPDDRTLEQRRADAAEQVFQHAASCSNTGGDRPTVSMVVRLTLEDLRCGFGTASIDGVAEPISIATARKLAADAELIPMVLGGPGEVLDVGRGQRLFTRAQRLALIERDDGCAFAGCTSPPVFAEAHHIEWWSHGGQTDLSNGVMLCSFHHHRIHDDGWEIDLREGVPYLIPPPRVDPTRRARRGGRVELKAAA